MWQPVIELTKAERQLIDSWNPRKLDTQNCGKISDVSGVQDLWNQDLDVPRTCFFVFHSCFLLRSAKFAFHCGLAFLSWYVTTYDFNLGLSLITSHTDKEFTTYLSFPSLESWRRILIIRDLQGPIDGDQEVGFYKNMITLLYIPWWWW